MQGLLADCLGILLILTVPSVARATCLLPEDGPRPSTQASDLLEWSFISWDFESTLRPDPNECDDVAHSYCDLPMPRFTVKRGKEAGALYQRMINRFLRRPERWREDRNRSMLFLAVDGLRMLEDTSAGSLLQRLLHDAVAAQAPLRSYDWEILVQAVSATASERRGVELGQLLLNSAPPFARNEAISELLRQPEATARPFLLDVVQTEDANLRAQVERVLQLLDHPGQCLLIEATPPREVFHGCVFRVPLRDMQRSNETGPEGTSLRTCIYADVGGDYRRLKLPGCPRFVACTEGEPIRAFRIRQETVTSCSQQTR